MVSHAACKPIEALQIRRLLPTPVLTDRFKGSDVSLSQRENAFPCNDVMDETITLWRKFVSVEYHVSTRLEYVYEPYLTHNYTRIISI